MANISETLFTMFNAYFISLTVESRTNSFCAHYWCQSRGTVASADQTQHKSEMSEKSGHA